MTRTVGLLFLVAAVMLGVAWFADNTGAVTIVWQGWRVGTSTGVLAAVVIGIAILTALVYRFWRGVARAPQAFGRWRRERRRRRGYVALTQGLVAVAAGDPHEARRQARRADVLLNEPPLTMLLSAQSAQLAGDEQAAARYFNDMLARPETEFLGLRGLLIQAMRADDRQRALTLARRARDLRPKTPWVLTTLFDLETQVGDWKSAIGTLQRAARIKAIAPLPAKRREAAALIELSRLAAAEGRDRDALRFAEQAHHADRNHPAAAAGLARLYVSAGKLHAAGKLIESEWARAPHPDLLAVYRLARPVAEPLQWVKQAERLARLAPLHRESLMTLGLASLDAGLWEEARRHLTEAAKAAGGEPSAGLCRMMARLEEDGFSDPAAARSWLTRAAVAPPDPAWVCDACGAVHTDWQVKCARCSAFDRLAWRVPDRARPMLVESTPGRTIESHPPPASLPSS
ncbi:MAG: heme biosynthesis protein HemY [Rhodospirillales bacterium]|nr:heme biosynthesis protein HemY [Rhodospirillales bacterium]